MHMHAALRTARNDAAARSSTQFVGVVSYENVVLNSPRASAASPHNRSFRRTCCYFIAAACSHSGKSGQEAFTKAK